jgi:hypothetical protein
LRVAVVLQECAASALAVPVSAYCEHGQTPGAVGGLGRLPVGDGKRLFGGVVGVDGAGVSVVVFAGKVVGHHPSTITTSSAVNNSDATARNATVDESAGVTARYVRGAQRWPGTDTVALESAGLVVRVSESAAQDQQR